MKLVFQREENKQSVLCENKAKKKQAKEIKNTVAENIGSFYVGPWK